MPPPRHTLDLFFGEKSTFSRFKEDNSMNTKDQGNCTNISTNKRPLVNYISKSESTSSRIKEDNRLSINNRRNRYGKNKIEIHLTPNKIQKDNRFIIIVLGYQLEREETTLQKNQIGLYHPIFKMQQNTFPHFKNEINWEYNSLFLGRKRLHAKIKVYETWVT
ncbi:hypothetical protein PPACK8108_LOCUS8580 [Phakopsora pachyrhizi]|uniref:Uncharacterized protein n=1 Tax=Phakopsora pachyrhizi TaxID=170000 RepID=A0AAV0AXC5_PHAPC|nr:hypothetical protein PPACK8108_LOCUS8580 [Phakopsora pachyrhizi]